MAEIGGGPVGAPKDPSHASASEEHHGGGTAGTKPNNKELRNAAHALPSWTDSSEVPA